MTQKIILLVLCVVLAVVVIVQAPTVWHAIDDYARVDYETKIATTPNNKYTPPPSLFSELNDGDTIFEAMDTAYRLSLDERCLGAVGRIHSFLTGEALQKVEAEFSDDVWTIRYADEEVGTIVSLPDFDAWTALLQEWVAQVEAENPLTFDADVSGSATIFEDHFLAPYALAGLKRANERWASGVHTEAELNRAIGHLVSLEMQSMDALGISDAIPAQALALISILNHKSPDAAVKEECLLADSLGYVRHATRLAEDWPENDPVRAYVFHDDEILKAQATAADAEARTLYIYARRLVQGAREGNEWAGLSSWLQEYYAEQQMEFVVQNMLMEAGHFNVHRQIAPILPIIIHETVKQELSGEYARATVSNWKQFKSDLLKTNHAIENAFQDGLSGDEKDFVQDLAKLEAQYTGTIFPFELAESYYQSAYYSAQYWMAEFLRVSLGSGEDAMDYALVMEENEGVIGGELAIWYEHLVRSFVRKPAHKSMLNDLSTLTRIGDETLRKSLDAARSWLSLSDGQNIHGVKSLFAQMDSRPENLEWAARYLNNPVYDLKRGHYYYERAFELGSIEAYSAEMAYTLADVDTLGDMLVDDSLSVMERRTVLRFYMKLSEEYSDGEMASEEINAIKNVYREQIKASPESWGIRDEFSDFLIKYKDYTEAQQTVRDWMGGRYPTEGLERVNAINQLASISLKQKNYEDAWELIEPNIESMQGNAMGIGVDTLRLLERKEEAISVGKRLIDRYPTSVHSAHHLAKVYWEFGDYSEAVSVYRSPNMRISKYNWGRGVGYTFAFIFKNKSEEEALEAFDSLLNSGIPHEHLSGFVKQMHDVGEYATAFEMSERLVGDGMTKPRYQLMGYPSLVELEGEEAAYTWLKATITEDMKGYMRLLLYQEGMWAMQWEMGGEPPTGIYANFNWLLRAAAYVHPSNTDKDYKEELLEYYADTPPTSYYDTIGRYLMDLEEESAVIALIDSEKLMSECGYYLALKAHSMGDYEKASDWYRVAAESASKSDWETSWSTTQLMAWAHGRSLTGAQKLGL